VALVLALKMLAYRTHLESAVLESPIIWLQSRCVTIETRLASVYHKRDPVTTHRRSQSRNKHVLTRSVVYCACTRIIGRDGTYSIWHCTHYLFCQCRLWAVANVVTRFTPILVLVHLSVHPFPKPIWES